MMRLRTRPPKVGQVFYQRRACPTGTHFVRHEVRIVDERDGIVVHRRWTPYKQRWIYEAEETWLWRYDVDLGAKKLTYAAVKAAKSARR